jgi:hypothetical protein
MNLLEGNQRTVTGCVQSYLNGYLNPEAKTVALFFTGDTESQIKRFGILCGQKFVEEPCHDKRIRVHMPKKEESLSLEEAYVIAESLAYNHGIYSVIICDKTSQSHLIGDIIFDPSDPRGVMIVYVNLCMDGSGEILDEDIECLSGILADQLTIFATDFIS